eukprot:Skav201384  [mRNA]  locus=scaffold3514:286222:286978:- [translate_table: standard]
MLVTRATAPLSSSTATKIDCPQLPGSGDFAPWWQWSSDAVHRSKVTFFPSSSTPLTSIRWSSAASWEIKWGITPWAMGLGRWGDQVGP